MCKILHIETATEVCSVSIAEKAQVVALKETHEGRSHSAVLAPFIEDILQECNLSIGQLDAIAVSMGPGSYTGLRIGISLAKGLCYGAGLPLIAVNTLESMCRGFIQNLNPDRNTPNLSELFAPMIDARRMEVFTCLFDSTLNVVQETQALVVDSDSFSDLMKDHTIHFFGSGADKLKNTIVHHNAQFTENFLVSSAFMASAAYELFIQHSFADLAYFEPFYLKDFITTTPRKKFSAYSI
jgi:tRNA threonylcarbamoyladenosine biosynthesis protein TsaB